MEANGEDWRKGRSNPILQTPGLRSYSNMPTDIYVTELVSHSWFLRLFFILKKIFITSSLSGYSTKNSNNKKTNYTYPSDVGFGAMRRQD